MKRRTVVLIILCLGAAAGCRESPTTPSTPTIELSTSSLSFTATMGGASPAAQGVSIMNSGDDTLNGLAAAISYTAGQPTGWLSASLSRTTAPASMTVSATTGSLAAGTYTATISISSGVADNSPQTVAVAFLVTGPDLVVSALTATISATDYIVSATVTNQGTGDAVGAWVLRFVTPPGGIIGTTDIPYPNAALASGASWTYSMRWIMSLPTGFTYTFTATADQTNTIVESNESNNTLSIQRNW
ncbi:MAG TPA: CARDB domain-containing protein [Acidobacteriota bacterium]|nr:CARDB domain-containing protein [Acidobacteriota bacterium]